MTRVRSEEETVALLRGTLAGRAAVVTRAAEIPAVGDVGRARRRTPRWVPPLAAAAAAAAVAGTVVAIQHSTGHPSPPANSSGVTHPAPTHTSSPTPNGSKFCTTTLPSAWQQALTTPLDLGSSNDVDWGGPAFTDGSLIFGLGLSRTTGLARVAPDDSVTDLLSVAARSGETVSASTDGDQAVLMVSRVATVTQLFAYDERTQQKTPISLPATGIIDDATVMDGTIYWDERASHAADTGRVIAYDAATGTTRVAWHGAFPHVQNNPLDPIETTVATSAGGVYLGPQGQQNTVLIAPRSLPPVVATQMTPAIRERWLVSDGTSYAWLTSWGAHVLHLWSPGMSAPKHLRLGAGAPELIGGDNSAAYFSIEGHWLFAPLQENLLLDLDTGAMAKLPGRNTAYFTGGGYLVGLPGSGITRLQLTDLPGLHC